MKHFIVILSAFLILGCAGKTPKGILSEKQIIPVLVDLHLAEAIYEQRSAIGVTRENYEDDLYLSILKKYKLDKNVFEKSVLFYGKHPELYKPIYDKVLDRLSEMKALSRAKDSIQVKK